GGASADRHDWLVLHRVHHLIVDELLIAQQHIERQGTTICHIVAYHPRTYPQTVTSLAIHKPVLLNHHIATELHVKALAWSFDMVLLNERIRAGGNEHASGVLAFDDVVTNRRQRALCQMQGI